ncbi:hypothetical protein A2U01_0113691, partial [Trifolium medium]|nr:hypothetical protein [Trifolium medium]
MRRLNVPVVEIPGRMRIETPSSGSVVTQL